MIIFPPNPASQTPVNVFSPTSTPLATDNYTTYTYDGEKWVAAPGIDGGGGGGTSYWERSGDTLNPINDGDNLDGLGSAKFAGGKINFYDAGSAQFYRDTTDTTGGLLTLRSDVGGVSLVKHQFLADGSAEFAGGNATIAASGNVRAFGFTSDRTSGEAFRVDNNGTDTVSISADGSATFAGNITQNEWSDNGTGGVRIGSGVDNGFVLIKGTYNPLGSSTGLAIREGGNTSNNDKIALKTDGSATFAGSISTTNNVFVNAAAADQTCFRTIFGGTNTTAINGDGTATFAGPNGEFMLSPTDSNGSFYRQTVKNGVTGTVFRIRDQSFNEKVGIAGDGSATFAGDVTSKGNILTRNVQIQLEVDDESQYETTTEEYEDTIKVPVISGVGTADLVEGEPERFEEKTITRTREVKTYVGPVLNVKDTLVKYETSLTQLKAAVAEASNFDELKQAMTQALSNI